jgi:hypothetical protein
MSLRDPENPNLWADGEPRSTGSAFDVVYTPSKRPTWSQRLSNYKKSSMHHSQRVTKLVAEGKNIGAIPGISKKGDALIAKHGRAYSRAKGKT